MMDGVIRKDSEVGDGVVVRKGMASICHSKHVYFACGHGFPNLPVGVYYLVGLLAETENHQDHIPMKVQLLRVTDLDAKC